jgi:hypothetical protein
MCEKRRVLIDLKLCTPVSKWSKYKCRSISGAIILEIAKLFSISFRAVVFYLLDDATHTRMYVHAAQPALTLFTDRPASGARSVVWTD